jgi:hypothetical protein
VWTSLVLNFGLLGSRVSIFCEVETLLRPTLGSTQCKEKVKFQNKLVSCHAFSQCSGGGHNASLYKGACYLLSFDLSEIILF